LQNNQKRVALVTGGNRGIGFEITKKLAVQEMTVLIGARNQDEGVKTQQQLKHDKLDVHFIPLDVTDAISIQTAVGKIRDSFKRLDVLVNNAGIMIDSNTGISELNLTIFQNTLETNAFGPLLLSQACLPLMRANDYGRIVNMSSTLGSLTDIASPDSLHAQVKSPAYRLSKAIFNGITVLLASELRGTNILVNSACPGWVRTDMGGPQAPTSAEESAVGLYRVLTGLTPEDNGRFLTFEGKELSW